MTRGTKRALGVGVIAGIAYAVWRATARARAANPPGPVHWDAQPFPFPPRPTTAAAPVDGEGRDDERGDDDGSDAG